MVTTTQSRTSYSDRVRDAKQDAARRRLTTELGTADASRPRQPPINPRRFQPVHATAAYLARQQQREAGRSRRDMPHHLAKVVRDLPFHGPAVTPPHEPSAGLQLDVPLPFEPLDPLDENTWDLDELFRDEDERRRRAGYGRHLEMAHVIREFGDDYLDQARRDGTPPSTLSRHEYMLRDLMACRTSAMGEHEWRCDACGQTYVYFNSCGNRHCPKCREAHRREWAEKVERDLLPVDYHHLVLTLPRPLTQLVMAHGDVLYSKLMQAGGRSILTVGDRLLGAQLGALCVLHSWGQKGNGHVHLHALVPAGGLTYGRSGIWVPFPRSDRFPSLEMLASTFRDRLLGVLQEMHGSGTLELTGPWQCLSDYGDFERWLAPLERIDWQVRHRHVWRPEGVETGTPSEKVVSYLARYANRVVIANDRLIKIEDGEVFFRYKDYRDDNQWKTHQMPGVAFLAQFLQHILPPGLHKR